MTATDGTRLTATADTGTFETADGAAVDRWGGKGAGLARMTQDGLRVPPGYVISTDACRRYLAETIMPDGLVDDILDQLGDLERRAGKTFGRGPLPLLLSVRSGAPVSMPGMMDTILDLGLGREAAVAMAEAGGDSRFMAELVARFHAMYSEIVLGALDAGDGVRAVVDAVSPNDPADETYDRVWKACEKALEEDLGESVPSDPQAQLLGAVEAVFRSWNTRRAKTYREHHGIPHDMGTAVVVQSMVFGNMGTDSGSGVVFTRNPVTGEPGLFGEYLADCQGEDVVAGIRTPDLVHDALAPALLDELTATSAHLEASHGDVLDIEFTVERSTLYFLQVRAAKRTPAAAVRIAADLLAEGTITPADALGRVSPDQIRQVQLPGFDADEVEQARAAGRVLATGTGACPGQVSGMLVLDPDRAKAAADGGADVVLARAITSPADLHGMIAAKGIVTATGGSTSHAAVVARALGTTCVVGASTLQVDESARTVSVGDTTLDEGELVSLDGATGELFRGRFSTATPASASSALSALQAACSDAARCQLVARIIVPDDVQTARDFGASEVLCALDEVLAARGGLENLVALLLDDNGATEKSNAIADLVATAVTPILEAAGDTAVTVQAVDLLSGPARTLFDEADGTARVPQLMLPLGVPALVEAQLDGLARAVETAGSSARIELVLGRVCDPAEADRLRELARPHRGALAVGIGVGSARGMFHGLDLIGDGDSLWVDLAELQASAFGLAGEALLGPEPLAGYMGRQLFEADPRIDLDESVVVLFERAAVTSDLKRLDRIGVELPGQATAATVSSLHGLGFRRFAVDVTDLRPTLLSLATTALDR